MSKGKQISKRVGDKIKERAKAPSKADMEEAVRNQNAIAYEKNLAIIAQLRRHRIKVVGNAKLNEDYYAKKKGRMRIIPENASYEWEKEDWYTQMEEARLKTVYEDTKDALAYELKKVSTTLEQVNEQQARILVRHPTFHDEITLTKEDAEKELNEAVSKFNPTEDK